MTDEWSIALNLKNYEKSYLAATRHVVLATELILDVAILYILYWASRWLWHKDLIPLLNRVGHKIVNLTIFS